MATGLEERPVLRECRGAARLRGSPVRTTWWEQDLTLPPEPEEDEEGERRPSRQGMGVGNLEERQERHRAERAELNLGDRGEQEQDRLWAQAHLPSDLI